MISENRNYDGRTREALRRILQVYGDQCESIGQAFLQHGRNENLNPPADVWGQVWLDGGIESLPDGNVIDTISCSRATAAQDIQINGMVLDGGVFTRVAQVVTLNNLIPVTLTTPLARVESAFNIGTTPLLGRVPIRRQGDGTPRLSDGGGLPATNAGTITTNTPSGFADWPSEGYCEIRNATGDLREFVWYTSRTDQYLTVLASGRGEVYSVPSAGQVTDTVRTTLFSGQVWLRTNRSLKAAYTSADNEYLAITQIVTAAVHSAATVGVHSKLEVRQFGGVWEVVMDVQRTDWLQPHAALKLNPALIVPPNSDIRVLVLSKNSTISVDVWLNGLILTKVE